MQGKGLIKFFLVLLTIVVLGQYLFILPTQKVERQAEKYAEQKASGITVEKDKMAMIREARTNYLDSMSGEVVLSIPLLKDYTYTDLKKQQLALGLDLKGGMSIVLQVDLKDFLIALSNNSIDPNFRKALENAQTKMKSANADFVTLFGQEYAKLSGGKKLASIFMRSPNMKDEINFETDDAEVLRIIRAKSDETVDLTFKMLKDRIDKFGVTQPNVSLDKSRDLINVELPGIDNPERARNYMQASAKLEFWDVYRVSDPGILQSFISADKRLKALNAGLDSMEVDNEPDYDLIERYDYTTDSTTGAVIDSTLAGVDTVFKTVDPLADKGPLLSIFDLNASSAEGLSMPLAVMGATDKNKKKHVDKLLNRPEVKSIFPKDVKFLWGYKPYKDYETGQYTDRYYLYAIKKKRGMDKAPLEGDHVVQARSNPNSQSGEVEVSLAMDATGAKIWGDMTTKAAQDNNREIAICLDDEVVSAPRVNDPILGGNSSITGDFSIQEAKDLANILQIGKLPSKTKIIQESLVGPSLGQENINRSLRALVIGFSLVLIFMIFYYSGAGIMAIIALFANLFFIFGALASYGTVLTLPGIAGIILTIGMAVDANVIIFERIREELRTGKSLRSSIADGFQLSYSAIIDANVTTILVAIILSYFGMGPIKGFAVVLIIGVLMSLFTAVLFGRLLIEWWTDKERPLGFWTSITKSAFSKLKIDWMGKRKIGYIISSAIIIMGIAAFFVRGFEYGVDFKGGYSYNVEFAEDTDVNLDEIRKSLDGVFGVTPIVKAVDTRNTVNITTSYLINDDSDDAADRVITELYKGINAITGTDIDLEQFKLSDGIGTHVTSSSKVGPTIADDIKTSSIYATIFALLFIFLYIFIRFNKWQYSLGAVAALFHDTLIVLGIFSIFHSILPFSMEIDQAFIAAILTVIGYSINDTVVVFDRIREFFGIYTDKSKKEVFNLAINTTFSRTIITSLTTLFVVLILFVFGGSSIKGFAFALLVGIVVGTYSSIFVASPLVYDLTDEMKVKFKTKKTGKHFTKSKSS